MPTAPLPARHLIFLLAVLGFASSVSMRTCDPMLPELARQFSQPLANVAPVVGLFSLAYGISMILFGPVGDRLGKLPLHEAAAALDGFGVAAAPSMFGATGLPSVLGATKT